MVLSWANRGGPQRASVDFSVFVCSVLRYPPGCAGVSSLASLRSGNCVKCEYGGTPQVSLGNFFGISYRRFLDVFW